MMSVKTISLLSCALAVIGLTSEARSQNVQNADIKITFADPPHAAPSMGGGLPQDARYPRQTTKPPNGAVTRSVVDRTFASIVANRVSSVTVMWSDPERLKNHAQTEDLLRELLRSSNTTMYGFHVWSWGDGQPIVMATVEHPGGKQGRWIIWCPRPALYWAYQDGSGTWLWGSWLYEYPASRSVPLPVACRQP